MAYKKKEIEEIFSTICDEIRKGKSLRSVLLSKDMPSSRTFYKWLEVKENDSEEEKIEKARKVKQYANSCSDRADAIFEECLAIADDQENDIITLEDGREVTNHNVINRSRLRVDTRKWMLGKLNPPKYGDKVQKDVVITDERKKVADIFPLIDEITDEEE